jgi:hypothetical protein
MSSVLSRTDMQLSSRGVSRCELWCATYTPNCHPERSEGPRLGRCREIEARSFARRAQTPAAQDDKGCLVVRDLCYGARRTGETADSLGDLGDIPRLCV